MFEIFDKMDKLKARLDAKEISQSGYASAKGRLKQRLQKKLVGIKYAFMFSDKTARTGLMSSVKNGIMRKES